MENLIDMDTSYAMPFCRLNVSEYCDTHSNTYVAEEPMVSTSG